MSLSTPTPLTRGHLWTPRGHMWPMRSYIRSDLMHVHGPVHALYTPGCGRHFSQFSAASIPLSTLSTPYKVNKGESGKRGAVTPLSERLSVSDKGVDSVGVDTAPTPYPSSAAASVVLYTALSDTSPARTSSLIVRPLAFQAAWTSGSSAVFVLTCRPPSFEGRPRPRFASAIRFSFRRTGVADAGIGGRGCAKMLCSQLAAFQQPSVDLFAGIIAQLECTIGADRDCLVADSVFGKFRPSHDIAGASAGENGLLRVGLAPGVDAHVAVRARCPEVEVCTVVVEGEDHRLSPPPIRRGARSASVADKTYLMPRHKIGKRYFTPRRKIIRDTHFYARAA